MKSSNSAGVFQSSNWWRIRDRIDNGTDGETKDETDNGTDEGIDGEAKD